MLRNTLNRFCIITLFYGLTMSVACGDDSPKLEDDPQEIEDESQQDPEDEQEETEEEIEEEEVIDRPSAADYHQNKSGLITPETLTRWLQDWENERPDHISGDLVILQTGLAGQENPYAAESTGVRVYDVSEDILALAEHRSNGIFAAGQTPPRGVRIDGFLRKYGIHPQSDLVVFAPGEFSVQTLSTLSMAWLAMHYWGLPQSALAILNGDINGISSELRQKTSREAEYEGTQRILELPHTNFSVTLNLHDVHAWATTRPENVLLWDARELAEFEGKTISQSPRETTCIQGFPACTAVRAGRIAGAQHLDLDQILDASGTVRSLETIEAFLQDSGLDRQNTHYLYDADGARSAIVAFVLLGVTGHDARWYSNSFVEWSALNASHPTQGLRISEASPWRTDFPELTEVSEGVAELWADDALGIRPMMINARANAAKKVFDDDELYLIKPTVLPVVGSDDPNCL